ncbi:TPA: hypothetical protein SCS57_002033 [Enterobacter cloacae]|nr:hypothetical protein [Enterobacter cloacae]
MFKPIYSLEDYGEINENGVVKPFKKGCKERKPFKDASKQWCITIRYRKYRIKNLIANTFIRIFDNTNEEVVYIDGNKDNYKRSNLEIKSSQYRNKVTQKVANLICDDYKSGYRNTDLVNKYHVSKSTISRIVKDVDN